MSTDYIKSTDKFIWERFDIRRKNMHFTVQMILDHVHMYIFV